MKHAGGHFHQTVRAGFIGAGLALYAPAVLAQDDGGLRIDLSRTIGLSYSDDDGPALASGFDLNIASDTRRQNFDLRVQSGLEYNFDDDDGFEFQDQTVTLGYGISARNAAFDTSLSYQNSDADSFVQNANGVPGELVLDEGTREIWRSAASLSLGREAPFGADMSVSYGQTTYSNTVDPDLLDSNTTELGLSLRFDVDRRLTATLGYDWSDLDRDVGGSDVQSEALRLGAVAAVTQTLNANLSLGTTRVTDTDTTGETVTEGLSFGFGLTEDRPAGEWTFNLTSDLSEAGRRSTAIVGATYEIRDGEFSGTLGVSEGEDGTIRPISSLSYARDLPRGQFSLTVAQDFGLRSDGTETLNSSLAATWRQNLTSTARIGTDFTFQSTDALGIDEDTERAQIGIDLSQDLTERWALTTRYSYTVTDQDGADRTHDNSVFVGLRTSVGWRP